jgi:hypothetical protein
VAIVAWSLPALAQGTLPYASLASYIVDLKTRIPGSGSEAFITPSQADLDAVVPCMTKLLTGDAPGATTCFSARNYDVNYLVDATYNKTYLVAEERQSGFKGLGTYIADAGPWVRNIVIASPHPLYDINTENEGQKIFQEIGARGFFIAGTHRCADAAASTCSGTTTSCTGNSDPYRISDAPHYTQNYMHYAHIAAFNLNPRPRAFNVHGNSSESKDVVLSNGTRLAEASTVDVNRLRNNLASRGVSVGSCNWSADTGLNLCGTDNSDGRLFNNSPEACGTAATAASELFLHMEQHLNIRDNPGTLIAALKDTFPPDGSVSPPGAPTGLTATGAKRKIALTWNAVTGAGTYIVRRSATSGGPYADIATVTSTSYTNTGIKTGTTYYYVVAATNASGTGPNSNEASATAK